MSYATEKTTLGRKPVVICEIDLDYCSNTYGGGLLSPMNGTCAANGASGTECYNTRKTCQDTANYTKTTKTYRFSEDLAPVIPAMNAIPCIEHKRGNPRMTSMRSEPDKGLGSRGSVTIDLKDFPHHDRGVDPYVATRSYDPESQGTYFAKLLARNPYWIGRELRVRTGYITDPFDFANFQDRVYVIDSFDGPDRNGNYRIIGKDILKLIDDDRIQCPAINTGELSADITDVATTATLGTGEGSGYAASGTIIIGSEIMDFTRSTDTLTLSNRGKWGTTAEEHSEGDLVQECYVLDAVNVVDFIYEMLVTYGGVSTAYIPYAQGGSPLQEWDDEKSTWLSAQTLTGIISEPTGVATLLKKAGEQTSVFMYWHDTDQEIKIKANMPPLANATIPSLNDNGNFIKDSLVVQHLPEKRITRSWVHYRKVDYSEGNEASNFSGHKLTVNSNEESDDLYGSIKQRVIFGEWLQAASRANAIANRMASRFAEMPKLITFELDAKDEGYSIGELIKIDTRELVDADGSNLVYQAQIIELSEIEYGTRYRYRAMTATFASRYGFIADSTSSPIIGDYTTETEANQKAYGYICQDSDNKMSNGDDPFLII